MLWESGENVVTLALNCSLKTFETSVTFQQSKSLKPWLIIQFNSQGSFDWSTGISNGRYVSGVAIKLSRLRI